VYQLNIDSACRQYDIDSVYVVCQTSRIDFGCSCTIAVRDEISWCARCVCRDLMCDPTASRTYDHSTSINRSLSLIVHDRLIERVS